MKDELDATIVLAAMGLFFDRMLGRVGNEELCPLISAMYVMHNGVPVDFGIEHDWRAAISTVTGSVVDEQVLSEINLGNDASGIAFDCLLAFLRQVSTWAIKSHFLQLADRLDRMRGDGCCRVDGVGLQDWYECIEETIDDPDLQRLIFST